MPASPNGTGRSMKRVAVVGAGIIGVTTAWYLREHGFEVTVYDRRAGVVERHHGGGPVHRARIDVTVAKRLRHGARRGALAAGGRAVNRDDGSPRHAACSAGP